MSKNDGGPAFPVSLTRPGMSLRDYFAAKAMQGMNSQDKLTSQNTSETLAEWAYDMADAMLKERDK